MQLITKATVPGQWVVISGANPANLDPVYVSVGGFDKPAFIDGNQFKVRCPNISPGTVDVTVNGASVGQMIVRGGS